MLTLDHLYTSVLTKQIDRELVVCRVNCDHVYISINFDINVIRVIVVMDYSLVFIAVYIGVFRKSSFVTKHVFNTKEGSNNDINTQASFNRIYQAGSGRQGGNNGCSISLL